MLRAGWNTAVVDELGSFPLGAHDDTVAALSLAFSGVTRAPLRISAEIVALSRLRPVGRMRVRDDCIGPDRLPYSSRFY
jgi:hypothetical protein